MKRLIITYAQLGSGESEENTIDLPMLPELAARVLEDAPVEALDALLNALAVLQGFDRAEFRGVEEVD